MKSGFAIHTEALVKAYGAHRALDGVNLSVAEGSVFGLLGPNGAGKTTFVRVLSTLIHPTAGRAWVLGQDVAENPAAVRRQIALTGQFASVDEDLNGWENLLLVARLLGLSRADSRSRAEALLAAFELEESAARQVRTYSGGMRRRLDIAVSILTRPALLFLDEPTTGLDPRSRADVWAITRRLAREGTTVLLTTQYLEEADHLAERIAVIDRGRVIAEGTSPELKAQVGAGVLTLHLADPEQRTLVEQLATAQGVEVLRLEDPQTLEMPLAQASAALPLLAALSGAGVVVQDFSYGKPSLDAVFFALTGHATATATAPEDTP